MAVATPPYQADRSPNANSVGTVVAKSGLAVKEYGFGPIRCTEFTFDDMAITMTDEAGVVLRGGQQLYDFPAGYIHILAAHINVVLTGGGNVTATWDGDISLGTAAVGAGATLLSTESDIIPSTATTQAVGSVTTATAISVGGNPNIVALTDNSGGTASNTIPAQTGSYVEATQETTVASLAGKINELVAVVNARANSMIFDGTSTAKDLYLNVVVDDADHDGGTMTVTSGTIRVFWMLLGDD